MEVVKLSCVPGRNQRKKPFLSRVSWYTAHYYGVWCTERGARLKTRPRNNLRNFYFLFYFSRHKLEISLNNGQATMIHGSWTSASQKVLHGTRITAFCK